jgi:hypothetical protein
MKKLLFSLALVSVIFINAEAPIDTELLILAHECHHNLGDKTACQKLADFYAEVMRKNNTQMAEKANRIETVFKEIRYQLAGLSKAWFPSEIYSELSPLQVDILTQVLQDKAFISTATKTDRANVYSWARFLADEVAKRVSERKALEESFAKAQAKANKNKQ